MPTISTLTPTPSADSIEPFRAQLRRGEGVVEVCDERPDTFASGATSTTTRLPAGRRVHRADVRPVFRQRRGHRLARKRDLEERAVPVRTLVDLPRRRDPGRLGRQFVQSFDCTCSMNG